MKIDNSGLAASLTQSPKERGRPETPQAINIAASLQPTAKTGQNDAVTLTDMAARMQHLERVITAQPVVNNQRVAQLQEIVNEGGPQITSFDLATRMIDFEKDLNNART